MGSTTNRFGWYLALLQLLFMLCWTVYAIYLPTLAATAGIPASSILLILMLDQVVFLLCDFATGVAADRVTRVLGRLGLWVTAATAVSCAAFLMLPHVAVAGAPAFLAVTLVWTVTSSALRAPPLMLLGKYAAKPKLPYLAGLAMLGVGIAGALAPTLAVTLRDVDPRLPFALASLALMLTTLGMIKAERRLADAPQPLAKLLETPPAAPALRSLTRQAVVFGVAMLVLALGFQVHFSLWSAPLFLRYAPPDALESLMPVFWIGFSLAMLPASVLVRRRGGLTVMGGAALFGALAILAVDFAPNLNGMVIAQAAVGAAWAAIVISAFTVAFTIGAHGAEGRMAGLLFSAMAAAALARMAAVGAGLHAESAAALMLFLPPLAWTFAGAVLLSLAARAQRARNRAATGPEAST